MGHQQLEFPSSLEPFYRLLSQISAIVRKINVAICLITTGNELSMFPYFAFFFGDRLILTGANFNITNINNY
ncbi:hypothetical protein [Cryptosporidium hominis TU502]|uniref:hypothetical protein n=1 Tax=Cryptosporidium hominis (strain TU502) TaxID=353151 RepID=UPI00004531B9|nr:hypothetical protein [Cryptosporidium hominis TU502]